jgi:hypothetical protein
LKVYIPLVTAEAFSPKLAHRASAHARCRPPAQIQQVFMNWRREALSASALIDKQFFEEDFG